MSAGRDFRDLDGADPWKLLGVGRDADADEIRRSYRRLSRSHHTDVGGDAAQQARLNRAYEVLTDPRRRADYALLLNQAAGGGTQRPASTDHAEPEPDEPAADPFEWSSGPGPNWTAPTFTQQPDPTTYTPPRQDPYVAPGYQDAYIHPPYGDPHTAPPYQDPYTAPPYRGPYTEPSYPGRRRGVNGRAIAALITVVICAPISIMLAIQALRTMRWSGQRGKTLAWLALLFDAISIAYFVGTLVK